MRLDPSDIAMIRNAFRASFGQGTLYLFGSRIDDSRRGGDILPRLQFLTRAVRRECRHVLSTDRRLFNTPFDLERAMLLETGSELSERAEAVVGT